MYRIILLMLCSSYSYADDVSSVWKGEYYQAIPIKKSVSKQYCEAHSPGTFTHVVSEALEHPIYTDKGIKLSKAQFMVDKIDNIYLIHGRFLASGKRKTRDLERALTLFSIQKNGIW